MLQRFAEFAFGYVPGSRTDDPRSGRVLRLVVNLAPTLFLLAIIIRNRFPVSGFGLVGALEMPMMLFMLVTVICAGVRFYRASDEDAFEPGSTFIKRFWSLMLPVALDSLPFILLLLTLGVHTTFLGNIYEVSRAMGTRLPEWGYAGWLSESQMLISLLFMLLGGLLLSGGLFYQDRSGFWGAIGTVVVSLLYVLLSFGASLGLLDFNFAMLSWQDESYVYSGAHLYWVANMALLLPGLLVLWGRAVCGGTPLNAVVVSAARTLIWMAVTGVAYCWLWSMA